MDQAIDEIMSKIDLHSDSAVLQYGSACFEKNNLMSESILQCMRKRNSFGTGKVINDLISVIQAYAAEEQKKGLLGWGRKKKKTLGQIKSELGAVVSSVDVLTGKLYDCMNQLGQDTVLLNRMYEENEANRKELEAHILAGKKKLEMEQNHIFEKKIHDMELAHTISEQMAAQIQMIRENDLQMIEKINAVIKNTIPAWKNGISAAIGTEDVRMGNQTLISELDSVLKQNGERSERK